MYVLINDLMYVLINDLMYVLNNDLMYVLINDLMCVLIFILNVSSNIFVEDLITEMAPLLSVYVPVCLSIVLMYLRAL